MLTIVIRSIIIYLFIIFLLRLMGKRQIGQLQPSELVLAILLSDIATISITDSDIPLIIGIASVIGLVSIEMILTAFSLKSKRFRSIFTGKPVIVIKNGKINQKALKQLRFTIDDLMEELRLNNIFNIEDVYYAIVETGGSLSVMQKINKRTVTTSDLQIQGSDVLPPIVVISDGKIINSSLTSYNISLNWLLDIVHANNQTVSSIFLMTIDGAKKYYIVPKSANQ